MNQLKKLKGLGEKANIIAELIKPPKYILPFVLDSEEDIILIRKEVNRIDPFCPIISIKKEVEEDPDLTGSPLYTSLDDSLINQPLAQCHSNEDEYLNHFCVTYGEALKIINGFTILGNSDYAKNEHPIWGLCDPDDIKNIVLMCLWREKTGWIHRGSASFIPPVACNRDGFPTINAMLDAHIQTAQVARTNVSYFIKACYLHNRGDDLDELDDSISLKFLLSWSRPYVYFNMPPVDAVSTLVLNAVVGGEGNLLWNEIDLLKEIICAMDLCAEEKEAQTLMSMTATKMTVLVSSFRGQIQSYVRSGSVPEKTDSISNSTRAQENGLMYVHEAYSVAAEGKRSNVDFTEALWHILKGCMDIVELNSCFKFLFREAAAGKFEPKILPDNKTKAARVLRGLGPRTSLDNTPPKLRGNDCFHLLFEIGYLKLQRDYNYILQRIDLNDFQMQEEEKRFVRSPEERKICLENLLKIHSLVEVLMILRNRLHLDEDALPDIAKSAASTLLAPSTTHPKNLSQEKFIRDCVIERTVALSLPIHTKIIIPYIKGSTPTSWSVCLLTEKDKKKVKTIFHSSSKMFPPSVYDKGNQTINESIDNADSDYNLVQFTLISSLLLK